MAALMPKERWNMVRRKFFTSRHLIAPSENSSYLLTSWWHRMKPGCRFLLATTVDGWYKLPTNYRIGPKAEKQLLLIENAYSICAQSYHSYSADIHNEFYAGTPESTGPASYPSARPNDLLILSERISLFCELVESYYHWDKKEENGSDQPVILDYWQKQVEKTARSHRPDSIETLEQLARRGERPPRQNVTTMKEVFASARNSRGPVVQRVITSPLTNKNPKTMGVAEILAAARGKAVPIKTVDTVVHDDSSDLPYDYDGGY